MAISLSKNQSISLEKEAPGLRNVILGLGWDVNETPGVDFDLDVSAFLLTGDRVISDKNFVFYNQQFTEDRSVEHGGDNRTGEGEGDDETISVKLDEVSNSVDSIAVVVTIHDHDVHNLNFGQVNNSFIRLVNAETNEEVARFDLQETFTTETGVLFGKLYRDGTGWGFTAIGHASTKGLGDYCQEYGVNAN